MRALEFITGHVIYNLAYTYKFQLKTTNVCKKKNLFSSLKIKKIRYKGIVHTVQNFEIV